ncbi:MAG: amidohydrolase family protein [Saprospiraceae bacterium]
MNPFFKIDIHTHILPERMPDWTAKFGYGGFIGLEHNAPCCARMMIDNQHFRDIEDNCWSAETRMKECDASGINVQVLSTIPVLFNYWAKAQDALDTSRFFNDHIADIVRRYPSRFIGLGTVPLQDVDASIIELERCVKDLGMRGVQIGSNINDVNLNEKQFFPFYEAAEKMGAAIFVHPWNIMGKGSIAKYWLPWLVGMPAETARAICSMIFGGVFEQFPKLRVAFAHGGGSFPATIGRIEHGFRVRPDLVAIDNPHEPRHYLGKFYIDSLVHDERILDYLVDIMGADKIALGTDYPFPLGELQPGALIDQMVYADHVKQRLLSGTALEWLGMPADFFASQLS